VGSFKYILFQNHWANFNQTWHKSSLGGGIQVCTNEGDCPSPRGGKNALKIFKNLLLQNQQAKMNQVWNKLSLGEGIQVFSSIKGPDPLQRGDNHKKVKMEWDHLKISFLRTMKPEKLNFT
jgi:hypothetical protein